ncbi:hypothetical protein GN958_ATG20848 [Phytophthora infestans]|uniref:Uncharacterized protein n=1 Tax=Phytophthora infestans TaxID=4787 RepID=A0A8S9TLW8_PHYIN|nr:hypothetical protein GN958_ATG20848 [Phytophthora infestans]
MDLGSDIASDSEDDSVSTSDSEYAATSPSLPEGEEGGWNQDSDQEVSFGLSVDSRAQELIQATWAGRNAGKKRKTRSSGLLLPLWL